MNTPNTAFEPKVNRLGKKEATRERILQSTVTLLMSDGLQGLSMNKISKAAGIAQPSFYNHYTSVDELIVEVREKLKARYLPSLQEKFISIVEELKQNKQPDIRALSQRYLEINMSELLKNVPLFRIILADFHHPDNPAKGELGRIISDINQSWVELIRKLAYANNIKIQDAPLQLYVDSVSALVHTLILGVADGKYSQEVAVASVALLSQSLINEFTNTTSA